MPNAITTNAITVSSPIADTDKTLTFETGKLAGLADGAVMARLGDTQVLVTATASSSPREFADFFPLTVDIEERMYAVGRIPGSFFRREGRASDDAILTCRLIDRPLRPNFPEGFRHDTHVVGTVLGVDGDNLYDVVALNGASAALWISGIPFECPIGAVRLAYSTDGTWIPFPTYEQITEATFEMVVAGRQIASPDGAGPNATGPNATGPNATGTDVAIMMVEAGGTERSFEYYGEGAPKVSEQVLASGLEASKRWINDIVELQLQLRSKLEEQSGAITAMDWTQSRDYSDELLARVSELAEPRINTIMQIADKAERQEAEQTTKQEVTTQLLEEATTEAQAQAAAAPNGQAQPNLGLLKKQISEALRTITKQVVRSRIATDGFRIDGRALDQVRPLSAEVGYLATAHGSALFQRGETQVLNVTTLGMTRMEQLVDTLNPDTRKRYMHHYNFPPFSTGEAGFMRGPKRREIGHGALAERAMLPVVPSKEEFPYALRLVSDVLSSNGSTSMASVCSSSLSLMDAGVPVRDHVSGIAMGLVHVDGRYVTLTDILGAEDAFGDMDFKVAGTQDAITALQLDTKIEGIPAEVLSQALEQARVARLQILEVMRAAIAQPREDVSETAPKIVSFEIPVDKIAEVIGPRGKVINSIQEDTGADISVDDDGTIGMVSVAAVDRTAVQEAVRQIQTVVSPPTADLGAVYEGRVVNITKFGAFINLLPGTDGLLHISKIGGNRRIDAVSDVLSLGDAISVKVDDIDRDGKISLSIAGDGDSGGDAAGDAASNGSASNRSANGAAGGEADTSNTGSTGSTDNADNADNADGALVGATANAASSASDSSDRGSSDRGSSASDSPDRASSDMADSPDQGDADAPKRRRLVPSAASPAGDSSAAASPAAASSDMASSATAASSAANSAQSDESASADRNKNKSDTREYVSFEEHFDAIAEETFGDLGPVPQFRPRRGRRGRSN